MRVFVDTVSRCQERGRLYRSDCVRSQLVGPKESLSLREGADQRVRHGPKGPARTRASAVRYVREHAGWPNTEGGQARQFPGEGPSN